MLIGMALMLSDPPPGVDWEMLTSCMGVTCTVSLVERPSTGRPWKRVVVGAAAGTCPA